MTLTSPRTTPVAQVPEEGITAAALSELLAAQQRAFLTEGPPSAAVRIDRIDRLTAALLEHADELTAALNADFGNRPEANSLSSDILGAMSDVTDVRENLEAWMADVEIPAAAAKGLPTHIQNRPKGVVGIIGPWNFPVSLVFQPAVEAFAAGNRVMIKFSEVPSRTAEVFARAVATRFPQDEAVVVRGGTETSVAFSELPFDHLFFTGSPGVGRHVAAAAGRNLTPVTLELGGKNPVVVGPDADVQVAAERVSAARMMNGGQLCLCPDYVLVPEDKVEAFVGAFRTAMRGYFPAYRENPDVVTLVDDRNFARVKGLVDDARAKGAEVITMVPEDEQAALPDAATRRMPPTLLLGVTDEMTIAHEEVFGPVISVLPYGTVREAIDYITAKPHPLAAYWYGDDTAEFREFVRRTTSGGVTRNDMALHFGIEGAPFGGVGQSGSGAYHGKAGFDTFSHQRTITQSALPFGVAPSAMPPYTAEKRDQLRGAVAQALTAVRKQLGESD
ncbi:aldehyde dehydrogenase family protein [Streptomyces sp. NPDC091271]|uniref:aldehyde dehydrogenase family protein n=1 Tax=Streptomyces sp. NPDC091271 TaxID=3365980 RepID=UPI00381FFF5A